MKALGLILTIFFAFTSSAESIRGFLESSTFDSICEETVWSQGGSYSLRRPIFAESESDVFAGLSQGTGQFAIYRIPKTQPEARTELLRIDGEVRDLLYLKDTIWILQSNRLTAMNLSSGETKSVPVRNHLPIHGYDHAFDLEAYGTDKIVVADGAAGIKIFDTATMTLERTLDLKLNDGKRISLAASLVSIGGPRLIVGADNLTLPAGQTFNGLIEVNLESGEFRQYPYASGVLSQISKMRFENGILWINNWGLLQYAPLESIRRDRAVYTRVLSFKSESGDKTYSSEPLGEFFVLGQDFFACALRSQVMTSQPEPKKGVAIRRLNGGTPMELQFSRYGLKVAIKWIRGPFASDMRPSALSVELGQANGAPANVPEGLTLKFSGRMPGMNMAAIPGRFTAIREGSYLNESLILTSSGQWDLELQLVNSNGEVLDRLKFGIAL